MTPRDRLESYPLLPYGAEFKPIPHADRVSVAEAFAEICRAIQHGAYEAARAGIQAAEAWLGPKEMGVFEAEMNWQSMEGRMTTINEARLIKGDWEGAQIMGLNVRAASKDGVRVGLSWPSAG